MKVAGSPGNANAVKHGATSPRRVGELSSRHRRRLLRRLALSPRQLDPIGRGFLDQYVQLTAQVELIDAYVAEHGLLRANGEPQPVMRLYVSLHNAARHALTRLESHLRARKADPSKALRDVVVYRDETGAQRKRSCVTLAEARTFKASVTADKARGEFVAPSRVTVADYYAEWLPAYTGRTRRGVRPQTKEHYAAQMRLHVLPALGRVRMTALGPRELKRLATTLCDQGLSENSVRLAFAPLKAMLATAVEEEVIRRNPAVGVKIARPRQEDENGEQAKVKALTDDELRALLAELPERHRLMFALLAASGLRIGELLGLQWRHVDFGRQRVLVRRRWYRGTFAPPKSRYGSRDVPLTETMSRALWEFRKATHATDDDALVFGSESGTPLSDTNLYRVFKPAAQRAGVPWATFHTLRHTCATALFRSGKNPKQVQAWLGHHAASFTMDVYVHLLPDDVGDAPEAFDLTLALNPAGHSASSHPAFGRSSA